MKKAHILVVVVAIQLFFTLSVAHPGGWTGFIYPDASYKSRHIEIGPFKALEVCTRNCISVLKQVGRVKVGAFECGLDCRESKELPGIKVCKKTIGTPGTQIEDYLGPDYKLPK